MDVFSQLLASNRPMLRECALYAAHELGLPAALDRRPRALGGIAAELRVAPARLGALLDVLALEGAASRVVSGGQVAYAGKDGLPPRPQRPAPHGWGRLAEVIETDEPLDPWADRTDGAGSEAAYHTHLVEVGALAAAAVARDWLAPAGDRLLDVGSGAGVYAEAYLRARPEGRATLVDKASVIELARGRLAAAAPALAPRVTLVAGEVAGGVAAEAQRAELLGPYDVAVLANVVHLHGPSTNERIVAEVAAALAGGGRLVVKDVRVATDRSGPAVALYFALNMALYTQAGTVYAPNEVASWLRGAGLADVIEAPVEGSPDAVVVTGIRPSGPETSQPSQPIGGGT